MAKAHRRTAIHPIAEDETLVGPGRIPPMPPLARTRIGKSLHPGRAGTIKLLRRFGAPLLLVRYRYDWTGLYRYTTVELLVGADPVTRGHGPTALYAVRLDRNEPSLKAAARASGGSWDPQLLRWTLPGHVIQALNLSHRVELAQVIRQPGRRRHPPRR
jgi:hypothetical protein